MFINKRRKGAILGIAYGNKKTMSKIQNFIYFHFNVFVDKEILKNYFRERDISLLKKDSFSKADIKAFRELSRDVRISNKSYKEGYKAQIIALMLLGDSINFNTVNEYLGRHIDDFPYIRQGYFGGFDISESMNGIKLLIYGREANLVLNHREKEEIFSEIREEWAELIEREIISPKSIAELEELKQYMLSSEFKAV